VSGLIRPQIAQLTVSQRTMFWILTGHMREAMPEQELSGSPAIAIPFSALGSTQPDRESKPKVLGQDAASNGSTKLSFTHGLLSLTKENI
jgi:hypothetical protein